MTEGILSPEQVAELRATAKRREANRLRKVEQRRRDRAKIKEARDETPEVFWQRNVSVAQPDRIAELLERQERCLDLRHWMEHQIDGSYNDPASQFYTDQNDETAYVGLEEGTADLTAFVNEYGTCEMEVLLLEFWKRPDTFAQLMGRENEATKQFIRYGIVTAIPGHRLHEFEAYLASRKPATPQSPGWTTLQCSCGSLLSAVPPLIADEYREKSIPYRCHVCTARERSGNAAIGKALAEEYKQPESTIFDSWGRVKL